MIKVLLSFAVLVLIFKDQVSADDFQCQPYLRKCDNGFCVASFKFCDGQYDCLDGSDEKFCDHTTTATTAPETMSPIPSMNDQILSLIEFFNSFINRTKSNENLTTSTTVEYKSVANTRANYANRRRNRKRRNRSKKKSSHHGSHRTTANMKPLCDPEQCQLPTCFCSITGTGTPNQIAPSSIPQLIAITFDDVFTMDTLDIVFNRTKKNPDGCNTKGTFFVSHRFANYTLVRMAHHLGHEIAAHTVTHLRGRENWENSTKSFWNREIAASRYLIKKYANITDESIVGAKAPYSVNRGDIMFDIVDRNGFTYDSTVNAPLNNPPFWPNTAHFRTENYYDTTKKSYNGWMILRNEFDQNLDPTKPPKAACVFGSCLDITDRMGYHHFLNHNFKRHYLSNRAPMMLSYHWNSLKDKQEFLDVLTIWMNSVLASHDNVYFVTLSQVVEWMKNPMTSEEVKNTGFFNRNCNTDLDSLPNCDRHVCTLEVFGGSKGKIYNYDSCLECPAFFPWIHDLPGIGPVNTTASTDSFESSTDSFESSTTETTTTPEDSVQGFFDEWE